MTNTQEQRAQEALERAQGPSASNFAQVIAGFMAKGIPQADISPKENVFTFWAWKAKGYSIRKAQYGPGYSVGMRAADGMSLGRSGRITGGCAGLLGN